MFKMEETFTFTTSTYQGYEEEVLRQLNANRAEQFTRTYLDWRYLSESPNISPVIFWVLSNTGEYIGMSALIFRYYYANNQKFSFAICGDISLNSEYRGKGIAKNLFRFMNSNIEKNKYPFTFVIPTYPAQKSMYSTGWKVEESLVPHVFLLDITDKINKSVKIRWLANLLAFPYKYLIRLKICFVNTNGFYSELVDNFDVSFDEFWERFNKENIIIRDKSASTLCWRYKNHPQIEFSICKIMKQDKFIGFIVYTFSKLNNVCSIYEFIVQKKEYVKQAMNVFIKKIIQRENPASIRIVLNENHRYSSILKNIGFIKRGQDGVFQTYIPSGSDIKRPINWFITKGDKDI